MGAEISKFLEEDALLSNNGVLLENQLVPTGSSSVRRTCEDIANRSQIFTFCQHWDIVRVTEFLRWYTDLVKVQKKQTDNTEEAVLSDTSEARVQADKLSREIAVLEGLLTQLEVEIESVAVEKNEVEVPSFEPLEGFEEEEIVDEDAVEPIEELLVRKSKAESELREKNSILRELQLHLLGSIEGVELREIIKWPLFIKAVTHVHFQDTVRSSILSSAEWHPVCAGFAMKREARAQRMLDEFNKGDILLPPPAKHELDGHTDDSASSSAASGDESEVEEEEEEEEKDDSDQEVSGTTQEHPKPVEDEEEDADESEEEGESESGNEELVHPIKPEPSDDGDGKNLPLTEEKLAEHTTEDLDQIPDGRVKIEAILKKPRVIKRSLPDQFDPSTRSPIFFGYTYEKQKNRVDEALESENAAKTKENSIFDMKIKYQKDKLEATLVSEKGKLQALTQKESDLQVKRERLWTKRQADFDRAKKELDPNDVFFRTQEAQDKKTRDQEASEDAELKRQKQNAASRTKAAEEEYGEFMKQVAAVRSIDGPLGDLRLKFHGEELERYEEEVNGAKSALATAQEEYAALTTSKLRAPGQEAKLRSQVLYAEDQIKSRENELERICLLHENEQFLFERAQEVFDREKLFVPLFNRLNAGNTTISTTKGGVFTFELMELAVTLVLGAGSTSVDQKIEFLFDVFARKSGQFRVLTPESLAEIIRVVLSVLSRIGEIHPPRSLTREFLMKFVEREFLKMSSLSLDESLAKENQGMTLHEFTQYCFEAIQSSKYLCELLGIPWRYQQLSRFVVQHMSAIHQYRLGLININDLKYAFAHQLMQPREELTHWKKAIIHERALAMGENDPLKTDYSKYLPKRRAKMLSNVVPLDHGGYRNLLHYRMEVIVRSAVKLQTSWRARKGRQVARLAAEKQAFYHARGLALEEARQEVEKEWSDRDAKPAHSVDKMKFEAKIRMKQVKLRTKGNNFTRDQVLSLMTEEAVQIAQKEVENRFREMEEELGYLKHQEALHLPHTDIQYLQPEIAKGLVAQLVHAKKESPSVGNMLESIAANEEKARQMAESKKRKRDGTSENPPLEVPETDVNEEIEKHFVDKDTTAAQEFRTNARKKNMIHGRFPSELYATGFTIDELYLHMTLSFPDPPLLQLKDRLKQVCVGMTDFKLAEFLQELPSKRHICDYVAAFRCHDGSYDVSAMDTDLYEHFRMVRGSTELAAALVNIAESDLDFGLTQKLLHSIQAEKEELLTQMVAIESDKVANENARRMAKKLIRMGYKSELDHENEERLPDGETNQQLIDPTSLFLQKERHTLDQRNRKAQEAHQRLVEAMKAWKEAEWALLEAKKNQLRLNTTYPVLPTHRTQWSERFQNALRLSEGNSDQIQAKYTEILQICQDFIETATGVALVLVREYYLPLRDKSILPTKESSIDGRKDDIRTTSRLKYEAHDILFKFCTDDHGRFESSHENAAKAGGHEVRNSAIYLRELSSSDNIRVPLQCTVDFQGFRVLCSSKIPIEVVTWTESGDIQRTSKQLVHGSDNRGKTVTFQSKELDEAFANVAERLNLSRHSVRGYQDLTSKSVHAAGDMLGYLNGEKQLVVLNFARAMPPEDPDVTRHLVQSTRGMSIMWRQLRPELVRSFRTPLSPDALSSLTYRTPDWQIQALDVEGATKYLIKEVIPLFAVKLSTKPDYFDSPEFEFVKELHRHGINMRHLGLLRSQFLFQISGTATLQYATAEIQTSQDFTRELDRGSPVYINGKTSAVSRDRSHRFDATCITLTTPHMGDSIQNVVVYGGRWECRERASTIRCLLLAEMVARTFKNIVRHFMRQAAKTNSTGLTPMLHKHIVIESLNLLSGSRSGSEILWKTHIYEGIRARFGLRAVSEVDKQNLRRHLLPRLEYIVQRVTDMMAIPITCLCLERVAQFPDCYTFVLDDIQSSGDFYRIKHNVSMLYFSMASLLLLQATVKQATSYKQLLQSDGPSGYWPLCDRRGTLEPINLGSLGLEFRGKYLPGCTLEGEGPIKNADLNRSLILRKASRSCVQFPYDMRFYPENVDSFVSLEVWCRCDGHESTRRVVMTLGRFCISALKSNVWAFSINVKSIDILVFGAQVVIGKWMHLVGTYDGTILRFYVDGLLQNEVEVASVVDLELQKREAVMIKTRQDIADLEDEAKGACFKEIDREAKLFFATKEGRNQVKAISTKLLDEHEFRVRLSRNAAANDNLDPSKKSETVKKDASKASKADFEPVAKKQILREKFDAKWLIVSAEFKEMRDRVNMKIQRELEEQTNQEARQLRIGCLSSVRRRDGKYFFHGNIAHVAYYNGKMLTRDEINAHYVMGTRDRAHESDHLFALAASRFSRALEYAPDDKRMLEKFAENICASLKYDLDHQHARGIYKKKVKCGLKPFVATENVHGIAVVLKNLPREPIFSDLFLLCYHSLLKIQPDYFQPVESEQCRLALKELGRMPFAFFLGSRSANSLVNIMSWYDHNDEEEAIVETFADIIRKVLVDFPTYYGDQLTNMVWLRDLKNPKAVIYFILAAETGEDVRCINLKDVLDISEEDMEIITRNNKFCTGLQLARCYLLTDATMRRIAFCCSQLEELDISYCILITDLGLAAVGKYCNRLIRLKMVHCPQIRDVGVEAIVRNNSRLEELALSFCERISDRCFLTIGKSCPGLASLEVELCVQLGNNALKYLATMLVNPTKLRRLNIAGCRRIGDEGLLELLKVCTGLQKVNLRQCDRMADVSIRTLTHNCLELDTLNVEELDALSYKIFVFDQEGDGRGIVDKNLLTKMKTLNLSGCSGMNDLSLGHLGHRSKSIESLNLSACTELTDQGLLWLLNDMLDHSTGGTNISHIDVSYCPNMTPNGIHKVVLCCPALVSLNLSGCTHLSDTNIIDIVNSCEKIVTLELAFCRELTDTVLYAISKHLSLEKLNLSRCIRITDDGMLEIAGQSSVLRRLNVAACKKLSDRTLSALLEGCRLLEEMDVTHCPLFSPDMLAKFAKRKVKVICRKLEEISITSAVEALEVTEQREREEAEKQQQNEISSEALRYMTPERRAKYMKLHLGGKSAPGAAVPEVKKASSNNLPPIVRRSEHED
ncbi:EIN3-binding F-box protein 1 [Phytophthora citrophthora]|uniref:EIN3-binding F-box protein 1 n=1 Tax=Phytophthora citrophthora TaxID=4793 RepID=A0AAD9GIJ1_9STRA|nr:EIN3-binding F-box protein 1 [Phytophthora citrophthora]